MFNLILFFFSQAVPPTIPNSDYSDPNYNSMLIKNAKELMEQVLDRFDPQIKMRPHAPTQKVCKVMNKTVMNYLKAGHAP